MKTQYTKTDLLRRLVGAGVLLAGCLHGYALPVQRMDREATLEAIHQVENPRDLQRAGPAGELGAYQFRRETWQMHTARPFYEALDRQASDEVAARHFEWLRRGLVRGGYAPTTYNIALAWNAGLGAVLHQRAPARSHFYAERVVNLAGEFRDQVQLASVP
ncbi:MAG TPA: hypothetical protein VMC06_04630 [Opitutaceae bacterium]|nr:hypothetical protein [Opitutaceae bacterium]